MLASCGLAKAKADPPEARPGSEAADDLRRGKAVAERRQAASLLEGRAASPEGFAASTKKRLTGAPLPLSFLRGRLPQTSGRSARENAES